MTEQEKQIRAIINKVRPYLNRDGGDVEFIKIEENTAFLRLAGSCITCSTTCSDVNVILEGLEIIILEEVAGIIGVEQLSD